MFAQHTGLPRVTACGHRQWKQFLWLIETCTVCGVPHGSMLGNMIPSQPFCSWLETHRQCLRDHVWLEEQVWCRDTSRHKRPCSSGPAAGRSRGWLTGGDLLRPEPGDPPRNPTSRKTNSIISQDDALSIEQMKSRSPCSSPGPGVRWPQQALRITDPRSNRN